MSRSAAPRRRRRQRGASGAAENERESERERQTDGRDVMLLRPALLRGCQSSPSIAARVRSTAPPRQWRLVGGGAGRPRDSRRPPSSY